MGFNQYISLNSLDRTQLIVISWRADSDPPLQFQWIFIWSDRDQREFSATAKSETTDQADAADDSIHQASPLS
jgi:hypothetical protein